MMYGPQMTPQGITYTLMPTAMAMQAHAVAAQMLYGSSQGNPNNGGYPGAYGESPVDPSMMMTATGVDDGSAASDTNSSSDDRSRSNSSISNVSPPSSGPTSPLMTPAGNVLLDTSSAGFHDETIPAASTSTRARRYSLTTGTTPRNRSSSDASSGSGNGANNAPLQQFEIGDRVYMYTLPSNIVQSVLLRGPITAQALRDSPYPYHSPRQLHYNPGVLTRSEKRSGARRGSQSRGLQGAAVKLNDRRTSGGGNNLPSSSDTSAACISSPSNSQQHGDTMVDDTSQTAASSSSSASHGHQPPQQQQQQRVVGMSATGTGNKKASNSKWPTIKAVRASSSSNSSNQG
jgi:hypothetical protein